MDRDSVAMGDDADSHRRELEFDSALTLGQLLETIRPDASIGGGLATWLVVVGPPAAAAAPMGIYAQEWAGARLFGTDNRRLSELAGTDVLTVYFRYLAQVDPAIAFDRYRAGGTLSSVERSQLSEQRIAQTAENDARRDEQASPVRYISEEAIEAFRIFGAEIEIHSARYLQLRGSSNVIIQAQDTMAGVSIDGRHQAYFRPIVHAEQFVVVQVGDAWRAGTGRPPVSLPDPAPGPAVAAITMGGRWFVQYNQGAARHNATFGSHEELAKRFASYAALDLSTIIAAYHG